jgi:hypothetical protein
MKLKIRRDVFEEMFKKIGSSNLLRGEDWVCFELPQSTIRVEEIEGKPFQGCRIVPDHSLVGLKLLNGEELILKIEEKKKKDEEDYPFYHYQLFLEKENGEKQIFTEGKLIRNFPKNKK